MTKEIRLCAFDMNSVGHQSSGLWRHPRDQSDRYNTMAYWTDLARTLERGLFDAIFLADVTGIYDVYAGTPDTALKSAMQVPTNDPFTLVPLMASVTEHLCFGVTGAIPYEAPYSFARKISSLDHLTDGRLGWNIVTGYLDSAARGTGQAKQTAHDTRYDIAAEYMEVVYKLWEGSWEDDAVKRDRVSGIFTDPTKVHTVSHAGQYFNLEAVHLCEPSPQRTPILFQAGASPKGQAFAAAHAECVFIAAGNKESQGELVRGLRQQAAEIGRNPNDLKVFALVCAILGETDDEAERSLQEYSQYADLEGALALVSGWTGIDLSQYALDETVTATKTEAIQSSLKGFGNHPVGDIARNLAVGGGCPKIVGSPQTIADELQDWADQTGIDGFNLSYTVMPESIERIVDLLVPELQKRGAYKTSYQPGTFREKLNGHGPRLSAPHPATSFRQLA